ncbi:MAG: rhomboid family intramembrane serine protease [Isosphaeraceae bacterium]|nr:rhomboid family intramembrane serine protease [Isosphaeraceae bacterium]
MRQIGVIADENDAKALADYLLTQEITTRLDRSSQGGIAIWVHREEKVEQAKRELAEFLQNPGDPKYQGASRAAQTLRKKKEQEERQHRKNSIDLRERWAHRPARRYPLTLLLIGVSILITLLSHFGDASWIEPLLISPARVVIGPDSRPTIGSEGLLPLRRGEVWRLVSPIFLHFDPLHLLFNMIWLYDLGGLIEMRRGTVRLALLLLVAAIASNLAQFAWTSFRMPLFGGMSGIVYALFGYVWMKSRYDPAAGMYLRPDTVIVMLFWLFFCMTGLLGPIANVAHAVGLVVGVAWGFAPHWRQELRRW